MTPSSSPLGKNTGFPDRYDPEQLFAVPRSTKRTELGLHGTLPFSGEDVWNGYEISWLNPKGKPVVALGRFRFPCTSTFIIESKSLKLYLNSFNQSRFTSEAEVRALMCRDLNRVVCAPAHTPVQVDLYLLEDSHHLDSAWQVTQLEGSCLDHLDIEVDRYQTDPSLLKLEEHSAGNNPVSETLYSNLLKSNCLITSQPDWASLWIRYHGLKIDHAALLRYIISFRQHNEFHEQCVERIFTDLWHYCKPKQLSVYARYTRRGGLDINPWRSTETARAQDWRLVRQ